MFIFIIIYIFIHFILYSCSQIIHLRYTYVQVYIHNDTIIFTLTITFTLIFIFVFILIYPTCTCTYTTMLKLIFTSIYFPHTNTIMFIRKFIVILAFIQFMIDSYLYIYSHLYDLRLCSRSFVYAQNCTRIYTHTFTHTPGMRFI